MPNPARFVALLGAIYPWASPAAIADLSEPQLHGLSENLDFVMRTQAGYLAAAMWGTGKKGRG